MQNAPQNARNGGQQKRKTFGPLKDNNLTRSGETAQQGHNAVFAVQL